MFLRSWIPIAGLAAAATVYAGGFFLAVHNQDNGIVVEAQGCRDYSQAKVTGRAEGIIDGKRQSVALKLTPGSKPGAYAVRKQWPAEGKWVLVFTGTSGSLVTHTIVKVRPDGQIEPRMYMRPVTDAEIEAALAIPGA